MVFVAVVVEDKGREGNMLKGFPLDLFEERPRSEV